jgi:phosphoribosylcarboxyaminoimidazole (NCAIR) mutase
MALDKAGATNAAILAAQILGTSNAEMAGRVAKHKEDLVKSVAEKNAKLKQAAGKSS